MKLNLNTLLATTIELGGSDLHLVVGSPPVIRIDGVLRRFEKLPVFTPKAAQELIYQILDTDQKMLFEKEQDFDLSFGMHKIGRFRVNVHKQKNTVAAAFRHIPDKVPSIEELKLPGILKKIAIKESGLVLVTGPTGSGKSTTLAAIIDYINKTKSKHIVTVENPIEFIYSHNKSLIEQRELGIDTPSFPKALKHILRQDPDVILIGELRDLDTITSAIRAAETGHLVLSTLHTNDAPQTIDRIIDVFPPHQQQQIRLQLSITLEAVFAQQLLVKSAKKGRILAQEIMIANPAIRSLIREGKTHQIYSIIETGTKYGMITMDKAIRNLYENNKINYEEASLKMKDLDLIKEKDNSSSNNKENKDE